MYNRGLVAERYINVLHESGIIVKMRRQLQKRGESCYFDIDSRQVAKIQSLSGKAGIKSTYDMIDNIKLIVDIGAQIFYENAGQKPPVAIKARVQKVSGSIRLYDNAMNYLIVASSAGPDQVRKHSV